MTYGSKSTPMKKSKPLTEAQKKKLNEHKEHHTQKHMTMMRKLMREGKSFTKAHNETKNKIGT